jgi:hypothetical protein
MHTHSHACAVSTARIAAAPLSLLDVTPRCVAVCRRNIITNSSYSTADAYRQPFVGESACNAPGDFVLDLLDGGIGSRLLDNTWGAVGGIGRCGTWSSQYASSTATPVWFAWFRGVWLFSTPSSLSGTSLSHLSPGCLSLSRAHVSTSVSLAALYFQRRRSCCLRDR